MPRRRSSYHRPRVADRDYWCVVRDATGRILSWKTVPTGANLDAQFAQLLQAAAKSGWTLEPIDPFQTNFFCRTGAVRVHVSMQPTSPKNRLDDWPLPAEAEHLEDCLELTSVTQRRLART